MTQELNFSQFSPIYLVPSLQMMTAARICDILYVQDDLIKFLEQTNLFAIDGRTWSPQKYRVKQSLEWFNLPHSLKNMVIDFSDKIGDELFDWIKCNDWIKYRPDYGKPDTETYRLALLHYFQNCFVWTGRGTVHYEKTARNILRSEFVTEEERIHLACDYCFEDVLNCSLTYTLSQYPLLSSWRLEKPWVCYWICRFFPKKWSELGVKRRKLSGSLELDDNQLQTQMLLIAKNDVALKYMFDRLDLITKEQVIKDIINCCDFGMKTYLLSQISVGARETVLEENSDVLVLNELTNILWQDCVLYYLNMYGSLITCEKGIRILYKWFPFDHPSASVKDYNLKQLLVHEFWSCLTERVRKEIIVEFLIKPSPFATNWQREGESLLPQILMILSHFNNNDLISELLITAESETVKLRVSNEVPRYVTSFPINCGDYKKVQYYPKQTQIHVPGAVVHKKCYLIHEFITSAYPNNQNPLMIERLRNEIIDVFVEYCRFGDVTFISVILYNFFDEETEIISYKSTIFEDMFNKLLKKAVDESHYYWDSSSDNNPIQIQHSICQPPEKAKVSSSQITDLDPFMLWRSFKQINPRLDRRVRRQLADSKSNSLYIRKDNLRLSRRNNENEVPVQSHVIIRRFFVESSPPLIIYNSDRNDIVFSAIDSFLNWYFSSPEQVDEFKSLKIFNERVPIIETLLKEKKTLKLQQLLRWFLSNDDVKIDVFKNNCPRNELTSLL